MHKHHFECVTVPPGSVDPNSLVSLVIEHNGYRHVYAPRRSKGAGGLTAHFRIPRHAPAGQYEIVLVGRNNGQKVRMIVSFIVLKNK